MRRPSIKEVSSGTAGQTRSDTRDRLLAAAIEMFGSKGFEATTMNDIAGAVGIKGPAAYNHFKSKEKLLVEAVLWALGDFKKKVSDLDDPTLPAEKRLEGLVKRHVLYQIENAVIARTNDSILNADVIKRYTSPSTREKIRVMLRGHLDLVTEVVKLAAAKGSPAAADPRLCALAIASMCDFVLHWYRPTGRYSGKAIAERYWKLARAMLPAEE